jgi:hypothetical protein
VCIHFNEGVHITTNDQGHTLKITSKNVASPSDMV